MTAGTTNFPGSLDSHTSASPLGFGEVNNQAYTLSTAAHSNSVTTITVASTSAFPSKGYLVIKREIVSYTGTTATTFTGVTRGVGGTTAAAFGSGTLVEQVPVAANHNDLAAGIVAIETKLGIGTKILMSQTSSFAVANRKSTTQSIATGAAQAVEFSDADAIDSYPSGETQIHDPSSNPSRFTFTKAGLVFVSAEASFDTDYSNVPYIRLRRNGSATGVAVVNPVATASSGGWTTVTLTGLVAVAANDYLELFAGHFAGGAVDLGDHNNQHTVLQAFMFGGV